MTKYTRKMKFKCMQEDHKLIVCAGSWIQTLVIQYKRRVFKGSGITTEPTFRLSIKVT